MKRLILIVYLFVFLYALFYALFFYRLSFRAVFSQFVCDRLTLSFLCFRKTLYDRQEGKAEKEPSSKPLFERIRDFNENAKAGIAFLRESNALSLRTEIREFHLTVSADTPERTAVLYGSTAGVLSSAAAFLRRVSDFRPPDHGHYTMLPDFTDAPPRFSAEVVFSLPLLSYLRLFGFASPDPTVILTRIRRKQIKAGKKAHDTR